MGRFQPVHHVAVQDLLLFQQLVALGRLMLERPDGDLRLDAGGVLTLQLGCRAAVSDQLHQGYAKDSGELDGFADRDCLSPSSILATALVIAGEGDEPFLRACRDRA